MTRFLTAAAFAAAFSAAALYAMSTGAHAFPKIGGGTKITSSDLGSGR